MKGSVHLVVASVLLLIIGCALFVPEETRYLESAQDHATQEEVRRRLGTPSITALTATGESLWIYQIVEIAPGGQDTWSTRGAWCDEYVLRFDRLGILRQWTHQSQVHGGELMPTYCVSDGFRTRLHRAGHQGARSVP